MICHRNRDALDVPSVKLKNLAVLKRDATSPKLTLVADHLH
jgi:hypothetical protein